MLLVGGSSAVIAEDNAEQRGNRPNVLFIAIDDLNHWVGYLGRNRQTKTPHIDRLARRGVRFTRSYCAAPVCNPSRTALLTGVRPFSSGVYENDDDWRGVIPQNKTLVTTLRQAGYDTSGAGKIYHGSFDRQAEWERYLKPTGNDPKPTGNTGVGGIKFAPLDCADSDLRDWKSVDFGVEELSRKHDRPFFISIGLHKPHMPWNVPRKYYDLHPLDQIELPPTQPDDLGDVPPAGRAMAKPDRDHRDILESGRWKEAVQGYLAAVSYADSLVGRLLDALDASPHRDNTIVVLWGDHGWHLGEKQHWRKFALWEEATRAPLIWVVPGLTRPDTVCERTVDFMTIYPTLCDLCGVPIPPHVEGRSIRSLLGSPTAEWSEPAITTYEFGNHAIRTEGWRYIHYANGDEELYDETADPLEWVNLANRPEHAELKQRLNTLLPKQNAPDINFRKK